MLVDRLDLFYGRNVVCDKIIIYHMDGLLICNFDIIIAVLDANYLLNLYSGFAKLWHIWYIIFCFLELVSP